MRLLFALLVAAMVGGCNCNGARESDFQIEGPAPQTRAQFDSALFQTVDARLEAGHSVRWLDNGAVFPAIEEAIRGARSSVNVTLFIWRPGLPGDAFIPLLAERVRAGVKCRVLVDPVGSTGFEDKVAPALKEAGCEVRVFRPLPADENLARQHRKLVIVDGKVGFTGGFGFHDVWLGDASNENEWREVSLRVEGPVVGSMQQAFAENWQEAGGSLLPASDFPSPGRAKEAGMLAAFVSSSGNPEVTRSERLVYLLSKSAKRKLWISQAYFTPNSTLLELLKEKARAGVDVRVLMPGDKNDQKAITVVQRRSYEELAEAGVRLYEWPTSMMHSKSFVVDDRLVLVGSINFDALSFRWLEEGSLLVDDPKLGAKAAAVFEKDLETAVEVGRRDAR